MKLPTLFMLCLNCVLFSFMCLDWSTFSEFGIFGLKWTDWKSWEYWLLQKGPVWKYEYWMFIGFVMKYANWYKFDNDMYMEMVSMWT